MSKGTDMNFLEVRPPSAPILTRTWRIIRPYRRGLFALLLPLSYLLTELAAANPDVTESVYARSIYPALAGLFGRLFGALPFSVAEFLLYGLIITSLSWLSVQLARLVKKGERKKRALKMLATVCCAGGIVYFLFTALCGLNYHRVTFAEQSGLSVYPSSAEELALVYAELVEWANELRPQVPENDSGAMVLYPDSAYDVAGKTPQGMARLSEQYPVLGGYTPKPKPVAASRGMSALNITGIYIPFTFEANVNVDVPDYNIPFAMMHELAHFKGFMREDEANFIAYLACRESDDAAFRYSGVALALINSGDALYFAAPELYYQISAGLDPAIWRDFAENSEYWRQFEGPVAEVAQAMNDTYLKANRQAEGVQSYGRMVDLLLADYRARHGLD